MLKGKDTGFTHAIALDLFVVRDIKIGELDVLVEVDGVLDLREPLELDGVVCERG